VKTFDDNNSPKTGVGEKENENREWKGGEGFFLGGGALHSQDMIDILAANWV